MNGFTEKEVYEAFGLGAQVQEVADPATPGTEVPEGAQVQELADPAITGEGADAASDTDDQNQPGEPAQQEEGKQPLTPEQRRRNADRRRQQEDAARQAATDQAVQAALQAERSKQEQQMAALFAGLNLRGADGEPITTMEQYQQWQKQQQAEQLSKELKAGRLTPQGLEAAIEAHPVMQKALQMLSQNDEAEKAHRDAQARAAIDAEIAEIGKLDASIGSLDDLMAAPYWPQLYEMTQKGYSIKDAHFLLNHKRLEEAKAEAARVAAANTARGKDHMAGMTPARGQGNISVPPAEMAMYRAFNPHLTDAEIQAHYNRLKKS